MNNTQPSPKKNPAVIVFALLVGVLLVLAVVLVNMIAESKISVGAGTSGQLKNVTVLVVSRDISDRRIIKADVLSTKFVRLAEPDVFLETDLNSVDGKYISKINLARGSQLTKNNVTKKENASLTQTINKGQRIYILNAHMPVQLTAGQSAVLSAGGHSYPVTFLKEEGEKAVIALSARDAEKVFFLEKRAVTFSLNNDKI